MRTTLDNTTRHGYTDHEHLDSVGLIHMNGRVYDPRIGRFLSRDPYIDGVGSSQGANGYAYVWNNPLTRWDPSGYDGDPCLGGNCKRRDEPSDGGAMSEFRGGHGHAFTSCAGRCQAGAYWNTGGSSGYWTDGPTRGYGYFDAAGRIEEVVVEAPLSVWMPFGATLQTSPWGSVGHGVLDVVAASEFPLLSQAAGLASGAWSAWEGDWTGVGLSMMGLVPGMASADLTKGTTTLYRAVSMTAHADIAATGILRAGPNSFESGKWFAESSEHAQRWGRLLEGPGNFRVIEATFPRSAADRFLRNPMLDGIGPARFGTFEQLGVPTIRLGSGP